MKDKISFNTTPKKSFATITAPIIRIIAEAPTEKDARALIEKVKNLISEI